MNSDTSMTKLPSGELEIIEEALSEIFECAEQNITNEIEVSKILNKRVQENIMEKLLVQNEVTVTDGTVLLTEQGNRVARQIVRQKRLAERLMKDVLNLKDEFIDPTVCQWEHVLSKEVTNSICTLLGHPSHAPNELPIPEGECCRKDSKEIHQVICSLDQLKNGSSAKISYLLLKQRPELNRLLSMGLTPGAVIQVIQRFPTYVISVDESQLAFDEQIAQAIFVHPL